MNYERAYFFLFNQLTELIEDLKLMQVKCEELAIANEKAEDK